MSMALAQFFEGLKLHSNIGLDHFNSYTDAQLWTKLAADGGSSVAIVAGRGGLLGLTTGATDNNEAMVKNTNAVFTLDQDKPIHVESLQQYAEANTDDANVAFGLHSAWGANALTDDGAGPAASFTGFLIYKVDGGTVYKVISSVGTTQFTNTTLTTAGGTDKQRLGIQVDIGPGGIAEASFYVNDAILFDATTRRPIKHSIDITGAVAMGMGAYVKAGGANSEVLKVDKFAWTQPE